MINLAIEVIHIQIFCLIIGVVPIAISWRNDRFEALILFALAIGMSTAAYYWLPERLQHLASSFFVVNNLVIKLSNLYPQLMGSWESISALISAGLGVLTSLMVFIVFSLERSKNKPIRGAEILSNQEIKRRIKLPKGKLPFMIGGIPIPYDKETRPLGVSGEPGVGKTQMLMSLVNVAIKRNQKGLCVDAGGDLLSKFYREEHIILAPDDDRSVSWSIFSDIYDDHDCGAMAGGLIPLGIGSALEWTQNERIILSDIIRELWKNKKRKNKYLQHYIFIASKDELKDLIKGTPSERFFEDGSEKMLSNILSLISAHLSSLKYLDPEADENSFSIKNWVNNDTSTNWLLLPYRDSSEESLMPLRRLWVDIFIRAVMDLSPDSKRRILGVVDEAASNGKMDSLKNGVSRGRKYGLTICLGYQNLSQLYDIYGNDAARSIVSSLGHSLVLRTPDPDTADYISRAIGDAEIKREQINLDGRKNVTSRQQITELRRVVLPSEITGLPDFKGYLKIAGVGWTRVSIPYMADSLKQTTQAYVPSARKISMDERDVHKFNESVSTEKNQLDEI